MLQFTKPVLQEAEVLAAHGVVDDCLDVLRRLSLDDFGEFLLGLPDRRYPKLSGLLPAMASKDVQESWTGASGVKLLRQTLNFVRLVSFNYSAICEGQLSDKAILDFGCGYGRIIRLMYYFSSPHRIYGFDPWDRSIEICKEDRVLGNLAVSDYLPRSLPHQGVTFDLIYCFSVFTHLSERATRSALDALRMRVSDDGLLVITIRPVEYWAYAERLGKAGITPDLERAHNERGFAFKPHSRTEIDGDITYGDTSISMEYLSEQFSGWRLVKYERTLEDSLQIILFLTPV